MSRSLHRLLAATVGVVMVVALLGNAAPAAAATHPPKVVIVVGPVGKLTDRYRAIGKSAAEEAARWTSDVMTVASPDATWPAVRNALQGASIVVYLGHGNGFPSPYRSDLYPRTQNGLGLNPVAGVDDDAHQYFGKSFLAKSVRLAPHAIVVLSHLCYASGAGEPGDPDPTIDVARQRADNFAAGWLATGAQAVVADAFGRPDEYIRQLFSSGDSIERVWRTAGTNHGNVIALSSSRTLNAIVLLDPTRPNRDYYRSLVWVPASAAAHVLRASNAEAAVPPTPDSVAPSLARLGVHVGVPEVTPIEAPGGLVASRPALLRLPMTVPKGTALPRDLRIGVRWQSLDPQAIGGTAQLPDAAASTAPSSDKAAPTAPAPTESPTPAAVTTPSPDKAAATAPSPDALEPPAIDLVAVEQPGDVVASLPATWKDGALDIAVDLPAAPGRYRLTTTIHDAEDVALDASSQALVAVLIIRISQPVSVAYGLASELSATAGTPFKVPLRLANDGARPWSEPPRTMTPWGGSVTREQPTIIVRWLSLDAPDAEAGTIVVAGPALAPGDEAIVPLTLTAPVEPGSYLLRDRPDDPAQRFHGGRGLSRRRGTRPDPAGRPSASPSARRLTNRAIRAMAPPTPREGRAVTAGPEDLRWVE